MNSNKLDKRKESQITFLICKAKFCANLHFVSGTSNTRSLQGFIDDSYLQKIERSMNLLRTLAFEQTDSGPVYTIPLSVTSDWPSVYMRMHQFDMK